MFSIVMPMDTNRIPLWEKTMSKYLEFGIPQGVEFIIPTRSPAVVEHVAGTQYKRFCRVILYTHTEGYNPSKALNLGLKEALNDVLIITSPEMMPMTNILQQLSEIKDQNVICQTFDEGSDGQISYSLVNTKFRSDVPSMYFLAMFQKKDLLAINGWDEEFMKGYAWEDSDFGERWRRAGIPFIVRDDIQARHQFHERPETIPNGYGINHLQIERNNTLKVIRPKNGYVKL